MTTTPLKPDHSGSKSSLKTAGLCISVALLATLIYLSMAGSHFQLIWAVVAAIQLVCAALNFKSFRTQRQLEDRIFARQATDN